MYSNKKMAERKQANPTVEAQNSPRIHMNNAWTETNKGNIKINSSKIFLEITLTEPQKENINYESLIRKLRADSSKDIAILEQKLSLKQTELDELKDKYKESQKLYSKFIINKQKFMIYPITI